MNVCLKLNIVNICYMTIHQKILESTDNRDPISLNVFWVENNGIKEVVYPAENFDNLIFYQENQNILRCFEKESLRYLKTYNVFIHPISKKEIPANLFIDIEIIEDNELPIAKYAEDIFLLLTEVQIYIDYNLFLELDKKELYTFYFELKSFYNNNVDNEIKLLLQNTIFKKQINEFDNVDINFLQKYILQQIKFMLEINCTYKIIIYNIIVAALSIVIPEINSDYYEYQFNNNNNY